MCPQRREGDTGPNALGSLWVPPYRLCDPGQVPHLSETPLLRDLSRKELRWELGGIAPSFVPWIFIEHLQRASEALLEDSDGERPTLTMLGSRGKEGS